MPTSSASPIWSRFTRGAPVDSASCSIMSGDAAGQRLGHARERLRADRYDEVAVDLQSAQSELRGGDDRVLHFVRAHAQRTENLLERLDVDARHLERHRQIEHVAEATEAGAE